MESMSGFRWPMTMVCMGGGGCTGRAKRQAPGKLRRTGRPRHATRGRLKRPHCRGFAEVELRALERFHFAPIERTGGIVFRAVDAAENLVVMRIRRRRRGERNRQSVRRRAEAGWTNELHGR